MSNTATRCQTTRENISRRDLQVMMTTAAAQSRKLARSLRLSQAEQEDAEQDILVMLVERWHYFDDSRGSNVAFAIRIGRQAAQVIADRIVAGWDRETVSLDASLDPDGEGGLSLSDTLVDDALPSEAALVEAIAVNDVLGALPDDYGLVASSIRETDGDVGEAQRLSRLSSSEFHRRLRELRYRLVAVDLAPRRWLIRP
ncbi:sigma factor [Aestuariivirga sp.]|uniref:sigma factor n=1 Tax=Aestuariivirga sp. TaxID=2650926 RepID=UPI00391B2B7A